MRPPTSLGTGALIALVLLGCTPTPHEGVFRCTSSAECPPAFQCVGGYCSRNGGPERDGGGCTLATFYRDNDEDGYGIQSESVVACSQPLGYAPSFGDCDDFCPDCHPGATERCDVPGDEDCLNGPDDGCSCTAGQMRACGLDQGACTPGMQTCNGSAWGDCLGGIQPQSEICGGDDEDCDGTMDEDAGRTWYVDGDSDGYGAGAPSRSCPIPAHASDNADDCNDAAIAVSPIAVEVCNATDDNCNGTVDEGWRVSDLATSFTMLSTYSAACDGINESYGIDCNEAVSGLCAGMGCPTSGVGPRARIGDTAMVECMQGVTMMTPIDRLRPGFCQPSNPMSIDCRGGVHDQCEAAGLVTGFGPVSVQFGTTATFVCVPYAVVIPTMWEQLMTLAPDCTPTGIETSADCNQAAHAFCVSHAHRTGFGPVKQNIDGTVLVACVDP